MTLSEQKNFLLNGVPVSKLTGNEFVKKEGVTLTQQVTEYYCSIGNKALSPVYGEIIFIDTEEFTCVVVIRQYASGNKKLYVHEVSLKQKLLDSSSNPTLISATNQEVKPCSSTDYSSLTCQGNIAKVLQKILSAK
jgi:hypothetical protein